MTPPGATRYPTLFSPLRIGGVTVRNRLLQSAHMRLYATGGVTGRREIDYVVARAQGGVGLMVTGLRAVHPSTAGLSGAALGYVREGIEADRTLTAAVRDAGAAIFAQLGHLGLVPPTDWSDDPRVGWAPSAGRSTFSGEVALEMGEEEIAQLSDGFAASAAIARESGFDGVELHFAHGYLVQEFFSPLFNRRADAYGGTLENRLRLARELVRAVRRAVGDDFVVGARLPVGDQADFPGGLERAEATEIVTSLESDGGLDFVSLSAGGMSKSLEISPPEIPPGHLLDEIASIKSALSGLPVFAVGGLGDPRAAEELLAAGHADMVAMTRAQIADPDFAAKAQEGREDEIRHCIRGNQGCIGRAVRGLPVSCTVNPEAGREGRVRRGRSRWLGSRVVVVGGGPAGLKAAETFALGGASVLLLEREQRLGGQVNLILRTPGRETFGVLVGDLERALDRLDVDVRLGAEAAAPDVLALAADRIVVATGAIASRTGFSAFAPLVERIPGSELPHVLTAWDVLRGAAVPVGARVLLTDDDGGRCSAGVAEVLLDGGNQVELVTPYASLFPNLPSLFDIPVLHRRLLSKGMRYRLGSWPTAIGDDAVAVANLFTGSREEVAGVDLVVLATAPEADDRLFAELRAAHPSVQRIGDCVAPRRLDHAIFEGVVAGEGLAA